MTSAEEKSNANNNNSESNVQETLALIKPDAFYRANEIIARLIKEGFTILERKQLRLTKQRAEAFYAEHKERAFFAGLVEFMISGSIYALKLRGENAIKGWRTLMGPTKYEQALSEAPTSMRALFATSTTKNACHGSDSVESANRELNFFFNAQQTLALIKPDAVANGKADEIIARIESEGFIVIEQMQLTLTQERAQAFYAEHQGRSFYEELVGFMTRGPIYALKLEKENGIKGWRTLMGPTQYEQACSEAPNSIRALYGTDTTQNASHGSDSISSAARELNFFFKKQNTLGLLKPDVTKNAKTVAKVIARLTNEQFRIIECQKLQLTKERAEAFYAEHQGRPFFAGLVEFMTSGPIYALKLQKNNAILDWRALMGPTRREQALEEAPTCLRALFGTDTTQNACHGSDSEASAKRELEFYFPTVTNVYALSTDLNDQQLTLALIKPDVTAAKREDALIERITYEGFQVIERKRVDLTEKRAQEFYAEHNGRPFFNGLVAFMSSGTTVALKLQRTNAIKQWRAVMGPTKYETALSEAPESIRALFATDTTKNACHGSDSVESAKRELDFFFASS